MRYPHEQVRRYTGACSKCTNSFQRFEERRKLPLAIAHAKGAISASHQVALPVLPRQCHVIRVCCLDAKYGGK